VVTATNGVTLEHPARQRHPPVRTSVIENDNPSLVGTVEDEIETGDANGCEFAADV
jgi:hypothetical protein